MTSRFLSIKAQVSLETLRELLTSEGATSRTAPGDKTFDLNEIDGNVVCSFFVGENRFILPLFRFHFLQICRVKWLSNPDVMTVVVY